MYSRLCFAGRSDFEMIVHIFQVFWILVDEYTILEIFKSSILSMTPRNDIV